eukprot:9490627-Pyramimonas_sp.AAC.1
MRFQRRILASQAPLGHGERADLFQDVLLHVDHGFVRGNGDSPSRKINRTRLAVPVLPPNLNLDSRTPLSQSRETWSELPMKKSSTSSSIMLAMRPLSS